MRIAQIIDILYYGGAQTMQVTFAKVVKDRPDVDMTVVSLRDNVHNTHLPSEIESLGTRVTFFSARKLMNPLRLMRLTRFLRRERFDIVHTHLPYSNILGCIAAKLAGIPVIASIRNSRDDDWGRHYRLRRGLETFVLRHLADRVMAVGHSTAEAHRERLGNKPIEAVPNALNLTPPLPADERSLLRTELVDDPDRPLFVSAGRLAPQKGYDDLLDAFAAVRTTHPEAALVIAGEGPLRDELAQQIEALELGGHARLLGSRNDVPRILAASDVFVSSSHWEGLSVAILEAMAAGLPIVATNVSDTPRVVVEGTGLVVPPRAPALLADAMRTFLDDPSKRLACGAAARAFIEQNHNPAAWADKIFALYDSVLRPR